MRYTQSSKKTRCHRLKRYLIAKIFLHGIHLFLILFAQTNVIAGSVDTAAGNDCRIGRSVGQPASAPPAGAMDGPAWLRQVRAGSTGLDPSKISVLSWNIKKGSESGWESDLHRLAAGKDLVLLQEARLTPGFYSVLEGSMHRSEARGWKSSGVLTVARANHLNRCSYQHDEPFLGTPKASLLTEYRLTGADHTLLVVNVHVVNFAIGLSEFREQIGDLHRVMARHTGPIIFSGDFNTWRSRRLAALKKFTTDIGLRPIRFAEDNRIRKFGHALDHIFVRGLRSVSSRVESVDSSDHNPLITVFGAVGRITAIDQKEIMAGRHI
ncbi:endonuclease/exonuclease/phosphatase family protein [Gammaproteobacteria bacterium]|nr:endonuclease/exonuclease/phosphatase family protein [Gammaproteobacteria bacterium]